MANKITFMDGTIIFIDTQSGHDTNIGSLSCDNNGNINIGSKKVINVVNPTRDSDAATKFYVDNKAIELNNSINVDIKDNLSFINDHIINSTNPHNITKNDIGLGKVHDIKNNYWGSTIPTQSNDETEGYNIGSVWLDLSTNTQYICFDPAAFASIWINTSKSNANDPHSSLDIIDFNEAVTTIINNSSNIPNGLVLLDDDGKIYDSMLPDIVKNNGSVIYKGGWDANLNIPQIISSVGTKGHYHSVIAKGNSLVDGISSWEVDDWIIFDGIKWSKVNNSSNVLSVSGKTGDITLLSTDITDLDTTISNNSDVNSNKLHVENLNNPHNTTKEHIGLGNVENIKNNLNGTLAPTQKNDSSDGYEIGSSWIDILEKKEYVCYDATINQAIWKLGSVASTDEIEEGSHLYYTEERVSGTIENYLSSITTTDIMEGENLYYTDERTDLRIQSTLSDLTTSNVLEGSNLYFTEQRFDNIFNTKTTSNVLEGLNLYYTEQRVTDNSTVQSLFEHALRIDNPHSVNKEIIGLGKVLNIKNNQTSQQDPQETDDELLGYTIGSKWHNIIDLQEFICTDSTTNNAIWKRITSSTSSSLDTFDIIAASSKIVIINDHIDREIEIDIDESQLSITNSNIIDNANIDSLKIADGTVNNARFGFLRNVRADIQSQIDIHTVNYNNPHQVNKIDIGLSNVNNLLDNLNATTSPKAWDDSYLGYSIGSKWIDSMHKKAYICIDNALNNAKWEKISNEPGEINFGTTVGSGNSIYSGKLDQSLNFKSFVAGNHISIGSNSTDITIDSQSSHCFTLSTVRIDAISTIFKTILYFPWSASEFQSYKDGKIIFRVNIEDRYLDIRAINSTENSLLGEHSSINTSGSYCFGVANPSDDGLIEIQIRKLEDGGICPRIYGAVLKFDS